MNDTPETDGEWNRIACYDHPHFENALAEFTRKLERERDKLLRQIDVIATDRQGWKQLAVEQEIDIKEWEREVERWRDLSQGWMQEAISANKEVARLKVKLIHKNDYQAD